MYKNKCRQYIQNVYTRSKQNTNETVHSLHRLNSKYAVYIIYVQGRVCRVNSCDVFESTTYTLHRVYVYCSGYFFPETLYTSRLR